MCQSAYPSPRGGKSCPRWYITGTLLLITVIGALIGAIVLYHL